MSDIIHLLPDSVANQIAAGEVIQRPASVLKELVENSIDAGADSIQIVIKDAGRTLIQITDNGKGMSDTDARMAFERHATSKIKNASDLFSLHTLGFRGEALASIAAVAQVELRTRREEDELGTLIEIAGSRVFKQESVQCAKGTTFLVKNLFFNVPARRRFLKSDNVEKNHLLNEFYRIALVYPDVEFSFFDGDNEVFHLQPSNIKIRIDSIFGKASKKKWEQQLLVIESNSTLISIRGYIGKPEFAQRSANQYFFVNGRYMRHPYFHKAVMMAYDRLLQPGDNPNYFIYFEVDPETVDINIHPTKTEIKFENEQAIWSIISAAVKEALGKFNVVPSIDFDQEGAVSIPTNNNSDLGNIKPPQTSFNPSYNPFNGTTYKRPTLDWEQLYEGFEKQSEKVQKSEELSFSSFESSTEQTAIYQEESKTVNFQLKNKYILTSVKSGMLVIDQQRAHIRILFDTFLKQMEQSPATSQQVMFPEELHLSPNDTLFFTQMLPDLTEVGFDVHPIGENIFQIKGIPAILGAVAVSDLLLSMLEKTRTIDINSVGDLHETIALSLAEVAALKSGQHLTQEEMTDLIDRLFACEHHNHTPDGKRIASIFTFEEIESRFK